MSCRRPSTRQPYGERPACAIYYLGWNELANAHIRGLDPGYADYQVRSQADTLNARRIDGMARLVSPTLMLAPGSLVQRRRHLAADAAAAGHAEQRARSALEAIYARNIHTISAINRARGIRTLWVGQVMSREHILQDRPTAGCRSSCATRCWPLIERLNGIVRREAEALGDVYVDDAGRPVRAGGLLRHRSFPAAGLAQVRDSAGADCRRGLPRAG